MQEIFNSILPTVIVIFIFIAIGFILNKIKFVDDHTEKQMSKILLYVVNPALIINTYQRPYSSGMLRGLLIAFALALLSHIVGIVVSTIFVRRGSELAVERFSVVYSNCGFMAFPIIAAFVPENGLFYAGAYVTIFNLLSWTHGLFLMSGEKNIKTTLRSLFSPALISICLGLTMFFLQFTLPKIPADVIEKLAAINTPMAMIIAGVGLGRAGIFNTIRPSRAYIVSMLRLLVVPFVMIIILKFLPVSSELINTNLIATCCPIGASIVLFSNMCNKDSLYASKLVALSTLFSLGTIPLMLIFSKFVFAL